MNTNFDDEEELLPKLVSVVPKAKLPSLLPAGKQHITAPKQQQHSDDDDDAEAVGGSTVLAAASSSKLRKFQSSTAFAPALSSSKTTATRGDAVAAASTAPHMDSDAAVGHTAIDSLLYAQSHVPDDTDTPQDMVAYSEWKIRHDRRLKLGMTL